MATPVLNPRIDPACETCGATFHVSPSRERDRASRGGRLRFCSRACYVAYNAPEAQFLRSVGLPESTGCIPWVGSLLASGGYGRIRHRGRDTRAHRYAWERVHGPIPTGLLVCHTCDNPPCVNVAHLFLGTDADNVRDMAIKGRVRGAKLKPEAVASIRERYAAGGVSQRTLAREFGVSQGTVWAAIDGGTIWRHVARGVA